MGIALDELSLMASTIVGATMALCKEPMTQTFQESLAEFLSAALDQMAASVSLINGRLPLDSSEEALQTVARCASASVRGNRSIASCRLRACSNHESRWNHRRNAYTFKAVQILKFFPKWVTRTLFGNHPSLVLPLQSATLYPDILEFDSPSRTLTWACSAEQSWAQLRMTSTAFFHSLTVSGYMLCIVEEVAADVSMRLGRPTKPGNSKCSSPDGFPRLLAEDGEEGQDCLDRETVVLMEVIPKVQVTGCWYVHPCCIV
jgi:hypothetical protein